MKTISSTGRQTRCANVPRPRSRLGSCGIAVLLLSTSLAAGCGSGYERGAPAAASATDNAPAASVASASPAGGPVPATAAAPAGATATLTVAASSAGTVTAATGGIACSSGAACNATYPTGTSVNLVAQPDPGYVFYQWGGACSGFLASCAVTLSGNSTVTATYTPVVPTGGAPFVLYSDILSGPTTGGEGGNGAYLSIFGKNFGSAGLGTTVKVTVGGVEVAAYRYLGPSKVAGIQQITVQVGALAGPAQGVAMPVQVVVGGASSNTNISFTPNPGRFLYVDNVTGNDATAVPGDITKPYRYVQTPALYTGGAWAVARPGDMIVMRGRGSVRPWTDTGFENFFLRFRDKSGSAPTGASGTGPIAVMGYPGEDVYVRGTVANGMTGGCISAINGQSFPGMGQWAVVTNLRLDCEGYDGPISQEIDGHNWRIVNNDLSASTAPRTGGNVPRMAGITGNGQNAFWYGNHIHDVQGSFGECHGIYIDGDGSFDIAYNNIHDIRDGNGFQAYVNGGNGSMVTNNINLHHNWIHDVSKHGVNVADGVKNNLKVTNNVVYNVAYAGLRFNTTDLFGAQIFNNTFYNTNTRANSGYGAITNDWNLQAGALDIENNIFYVASGTPYNSGSNGVPTSAGTIKNNLWFNGSGSTSFDAAAIAGDPLFVNPGTDFHLKAGSPAIARGGNSSTLAAIVATDFDVKARNSASMDLGAYKF